MAESRKADKMSRAESVRQAGHGLLPNSLAVATARTQNVEANREKAATMRQQYMESLVRRSAAMEDLRFCAKQNIQFHRLEKEESRVRKEDKERERMEGLAEMRRRDQMDLMRSRREDTERAKNLHDKVKTGQEYGTQKKKAHTERYRREARKAEFGTRPGQEKNKVESIY